MSVWLYRQQYRLSVLEPQGPEQFELSAGRPGALRRLQMRVIALLRLLLGLELLPSHRPMG